METHQQRVVDESIALDDKLTKLENFMKSPAFLRGKEGA